MERMLIAIDDSDGSMKAVEFAARHFTRATDLQITLLHVYPDLPPMFWDDGHILDGIEKSAREDEINRWKAEKKNKMAPIFKTASVIFLLKTVCN